MKLETLAMMYQLKNKLSATSFGKAHKDYSVYRFVNDNKLEIPFNFLENERNKLFQKYGENKGDRIVIKEEHIADYQMDLNEILNQEITEFPILHLSSNDFEECVYSNNKDYWLRADDIDAIETYLREQKKRED